MPGLFSCMMSRNIVTSPQNRAAVPGVSLVASQGWLKKASSRSRRPSVTTTLVSVLRRAHFCTSVIGISALVSSERTVTFLTRPFTVAWSPTSSSSNGVSSPFFR